MEQMYKLDDNATFEYFQFWWFSLVFGNNPSGVEVPLKRRMIQVSEESPDGVGRRLKEPVDFPLSNAERSALIERMGAIQWSEKASATARAATRFLMGLDTENG